MKAKAYNGHNHNTRLHNTNFLSASSLNPESQVVQYHPAENSLVVKQC